jgi:hypothetical protein
MRVRVQASESGAAVLAVARALGVGPADARKLLAEERVLPAQLTAEQASALRDALAKHGVKAELVEVPPTSARCETHPTLTPEYVCTSCRAPTCVVCGERCARCAAKAARAAKWKGRRVAVLLVVLLGVGFAAALKTRRLARRTDWSRPVQVSVTLTSAQPVSQVVQRAWELQLEKLTDWASAQAARAGLPLARPIVFRLMTEVREVTLEPPPAATGAWLADSRAAYTYSQQVAPLVAKTGDVRLLVVLGSGTFGQGRVEGIAERGGELGVVFASAQDTALTLELMAVAHETLHCLGALDAYDDEGRALVPQGLTEPTASPLYPQRAAEVMVGEVPLSPTSGRLPKSLDEVEIGPTTAAAIGWHERAP